MESKTMEEIVEKALGKEVWLKHLKEDLMKYWDNDAATSMSTGLFPTYRTNTGELLPSDPEQWPVEFKEAYRDPNTKGLIEPKFNFIRAHSRQTYAYGIAFHMTGERQYLELCRKGALALVDAMDGNYGMYTKLNTETKEWDVDRMLRNSQDLAYGLTGLGMYYFLTHDIGIMYKIIQIKEYIFKMYMDDGKGYLTWYPKKDKKNKEIQIVAQLDQLYAYMLMITPALPEPHKSIWKKDMKKIVDILITQFYSEKYEMFWGIENNYSSMTLGTDHTDFGHSVKTFWVIQKVGEILGDPFYIEFARPKIEKILKDAFIAGDEGLYGSWGRRFDKKGELDKDKEWWILAELDQACEILAIHDPSYYEYLNDTQRYWLEVMVDKEYGEMWHMVSAKDNKPMIQYPKVHSWKTSLHSFEHALFSYMTAARIKDKNVSLYYALPKEERVSHRTVAPYMFFGNVVKINKKNTKINDFMPDGNIVYKIKYNGIH